MDCSEYRKDYAAFSRLPLPQEVADTPEWEAWIEHRHGCVACTDWTLAQRVVARGFAIEDFPCVHLAHEVTSQCEDHPDASDCPDVHIVYLPRFDEYLFRRGDAPMAVIRFCPWCATRLPESKRNRWFDELAARGFDEPYNQEIPESYRTDAWHRPQDTTGQAKASPPHHPVRAAVRGFLALLESDAPTGLDLDDALRRCLDELAMARHLADYHFDEVDYPDPPEHDYLATRRQAERRFVDYGCYNTPANVLEQIGTAECHVGDAIDDLTDIAVELRDVEWCWENTSEADALWHFTHGFDVHWIAHLRGLQLYLLARRGMA